MVDLKRKIEAEHVIRDPRRAFTTADQDAILERQHGACADCGRRFDRRNPGRGPDRWTGYPPVFHHEILHKDGGATSLDNAVALCRHCHHWGRHQKTQSWCLECQRGEKANELPPEPSHGS